MSVGEDDARLPASLRGISRPIIRDDVAGHLDILISQIVIDDVAEVENQHLQLFDIPFQVGVR